MKKIISILLVITTNLTAYTQCSTVAVQISSSDTTLVQLYHAGFFNIPSGFDNICEWEVTTFSGEIIHQDTTSGGSTDQSTSLFNHSVPLTDSMKVTIFITNTTEGITCTMNDTLYWKETEILPGSFIGNWDVLSSNGGVEDMITSTSELDQNAENLKVFPCPAQDYFQINGKQNIVRLTISNLSGQVLESIQNVEAQDRIDISSYQSGVYFIQFWDGDDRSVGVRKIVKM